MPEPQTTEEKLVFLLGQYSKTQNPVYLMGAFAYITGVNSTSDYILVPRDMAVIIANAFSGYVNGSCEGRNISLEQAFGITTEHKSASTYTSLETMIDRTHRYRWLFGLRNGEAVTAVYRKYKNDIASLKLEMKYQGVTFDEGSFSQYYQDRAKKGFKHWVDTETTLAKAELIEHYRENELSKLDEGTARYIRARMKWKKL